MNWSWIPQLFSNVIGQVAPGALLIIMTTIVLQSPLHALSLILDTQFRQGVFSVGGFVVFSLLSAMVGFVFGELWRFTLGKLTEKSEDTTESRVREYRLNEHNQLQNILGQSELAVDIKAMPETFVMHEQLRLVIPGEAARLVKLRAEKRLCHTLVLGSFMLLIVNAIILFRAPTFDRFVLEAFLLLIIIGSWARSLRLRKWWVSGIMVLWLSLISSGTLPIRKDSELN